jgi:hypothetical protein
MGSVVSIFEHILTKRLQKKWNTDSLCIIFRGAIDQNALDLDDWSVFIEIIDLDRSITYNTIENTELFRKYISQLEQKRNLKSMYFKIQNIVERLRMHDLENAIYFVSTEPLILTGMSFYIALIIVIAVILDITFNWIDLF